MSSGPRPPALDFGDLQGWQAEDHAAAFAVFAATSDLIDAPRWAAVKAAARSRTADPRRFFETWFRPVLISDTAIFTGYFEPELAAARDPAPRHRHPLYKMPPEATGLWYSRAEIEEGRLRGRPELVLAWLEDPLDVFFLQVQGSGRISFPDGTTIRIGYAGRNGHPYRSIGQELVRRGAVPADAISAQAIRDWARANPEALPALLRHNPSYVFFREIPDANPDHGPLGTMNHPVTALRSLAVDPGHIPLGAPVWIAKAAPDPLHRLMVAQDTGSAIQGPRRADIFLGTGAAAGQKAGRMRDPGRLIALLPRDGADEPAPGG